MKNLLSIKTLRKLAASSLAAALGVAVPGITSASGPSSVAQPVKGTPLGITMVKLSPGQFYVGGLNASGILLPAGAVDHVLSMGRHIETVHPGADILVAHLRGPELNQVLVLPNQDLGIEPDGEQVKVGVWDADNPEEYRFQKVSQRLLRGIQGQLAQVVQDIHVNLGLGGAGKAREIFGKPFDASKLGASLAINVSEEQGILPGGGGTGVLSAQDVLNPSKAGYAAVFVRIPAGKFQMGSPDGKKGTKAEKGRYGDEIPHEVEFERPLLVQAAPVTQEQFRALMGYNPSYFTDEKYSDGDYRVVNGQGENARHPVESVSHGEAAAFANALSELEGLQPAYEIIRDRTGRIMDIPSCIMMLSSLDGRADSA